MVFKPEPISDSGRLVGCKKCGTSLSNEHYLESKNFVGQTGRAYLFSDVKNVWEKEVADDRQMRSGRFLVADIGCSMCLEKLGWTYVKSFSKDQKYKVGMFILERARISYL
ncbi:Yippee-like protein [Pseudohyphozyma bogoriensis]|nr:Yippee-like protein [Pseudohyphozyma bogoriensis]